MRVENFVKSLRTVPLNKEIYKKADYSEEIINDIIDSFTLNLKEQEYVKNDNPILELIDNYNVENFQACFVSFLEEYKRVEIGIFFGNIDADLLLVDNETKEVLLIDSNNLEHVMLKCAVSSSSFLNALVLSARFNEEKAINDDIYENQQLILENAIAFSNIAGGEKYLDFYKMILGCEI